MSSKIFVGGLSWNTTQDQLNDAFSPFGEVLEAIIITDRDTGRSRGFGFVTFSNAQESTDAIDQLNGTVLDGRTINVNIARERQDRGSRNNGGGGGNNRW